jgi:hypothetical protein
MEGVIPESVDYLSSSQVPLFSNGEARSVSIDGYKLLILVASFCFFFCFVSVDHCLRYHSSIGGKLVERNEWFQKSENVISFRRKLKSVCQSEYVTHSFCHFHSRYFPSCLESETSSEEKEI